MQQLDNNSSLQNNQMQDLGISKQNQEVSGSKVSNIQKKRIIKENRKKNQQFKKLDLDNSSDGKSDEENENLENLIIGDESFKALKCLTKNYQLTYKQIKNSKELKQYPLKDLTKDEIQYLIRKERYYQTRKFGIDFDNQGKKFSIRNTMKRKNPDYNEESKDIEPSIIVDEEVNNQASNQNSYLQELSKILILDFKNQPFTAQKKIIDTISNLVQQDNTLFYASIEKQVKDHLDECQILFQERKFGELKFLLNQISPMSSIILNLLISQKLYNLSDESKTLAQTFLPYLKMCPNFDFLNDELKNTSIRFINTIVQYYLDSELPIDIGFATFAIKISPHLIQSIIKTEEDKRNLSKALQQYGFKKEVSQTLAENPQNFLWKEMIDFLSRQDMSEQNEYTNIFSKMIIIQNPGPFIKEFVDLLVQRGLFTISLMNCQKINLTIQQVIQVLNILKNKSAETIKQCLSKDSNYWIQDSNQQQSKEFKQEDQIDHEKIQQFLRSMLKESFDQQNDKQEKLIKVSKEIQQQSDCYQHNLYQCAIAQIITDSQDKYKIIEMPTGSGKTWVQAILAKYYIDQGLKVTIIEPTENLKNQTQELLSNIDYDLSVVTIEQFYEYPPQDEVIIVNEYDLIIQNYSFKTVTYGLTGLWQLLNRQVFFFTSTTNKFHEKIIRNIFQKFQVLKFKSEYEFVKNVSSISQGIIKTFKNFEEILNEIIKDIAITYNEKPIIVFCEKENQQIFIELFERNNFNKILKGSSQQNLKEIRTWKYGILILDPEDGIGVNCQFSQDSIVLITNEMKTESQYLQTQGRSSRARGLCNSIYYTVTHLNHQTILRNMKNQNLTEMEELERLLKVIWQKRTVKSLQDHLEDSMAQGDQIKSLKDLKTILGNTLYTKIMKEIQF